MIEKVQVLWYLNKDDFANYCLDFKPYENHKIDGYEICEVDEDLIYDLCDKDSERLEPIGYFKNKKEVENHLREIITNNELDLEIGSPELENKISEAIKTIDFDGEDYYISVGEDELGSKYNIIQNWYKALKKEYDSSSKDNMWVLMVTGYDPYDLKPSGKVLTYVLGDILNLNESYFDDLIPNKGILEVDEWNKILDKVYRRNKLYLGLNRVV